MELQQGTTMIDCKTALRLLFNCFLSDWGNSSDLWGCIEGMGTAWSIRRQFGPFQLFPLLPTTIMSETCIYGL